MHIAKMFPFNALPNITKLLLAFKLASGIGSIRTLAYLSASKLAVGPN